MNFELSEEQEMVRETAKSFAQEVLAKNVDERDEEERFPEEEIKQMGELGFMGIMVPEEYDGAGMDPVSYVVMLEEIAKVDASSAVIVSVNNSLVCEVFLKYGSEEQKEKYLKPLAGGRQLGAFSLSEAGAGSDPGSLICSAKKVGDGYILNGTKNFTTNGASADVIIVFATLDRNLGYKGISAFIVEKGTPGFRVSKKERKMGIRSSDTCELTFEDCRIPLDNLIGPEGKGLSIALSVLDGGRMGVAAQAVGIARASLEVALNYAKERKQFGKTLSEFSAIQSKLADMATEIECARMMLYHAAFLRQIGKDYVQAAAMAKLKASQVAVWASDEAVQILGGYGYLKDFPVERYFRDAKITELYEGTTEIQKLVIARKLLSE
ncbi:acyl-CoA dehydrogenase family protein [candidate division KSB1 bacterium]|nr:acyl-CoA dehydrogenase family protein [candidate division KSB1 bacterium]